MDIKKLIMGGLCSCLRGNKTEEGEGGRLLQDPSTNDYSCNDLTTTIAPTFRSHNVSSMGYGSYGQPSGYLQTEGGNMDAPEGTSSQNMTSWDRTLYKLQEKLIDVSALNTCPSYEINEAKEKEAKYKRSLIANEKAIIDTIEDIKTSLKFTSLKKPSDALTNDKLVEPVDTEELNAISTFARQAALIHNQVFTINISEDIVVPFPSI